MKRIIRTSVVLLIGFAVSGLAAPKPSGSALNWQELPPLPAAAGQAEQIGVAGPFAGVHNDALIVAGGANFPEGLPWNKREDGTSPPKVYHDDIFVLVKDGDSHKWIVAETKLPGPIGYGVSISTPNGVLCIGGEWKTAPDAEGKQTMYRSDKVYRLLWDADAKGVAVDESLPLLPDPATAQAGALIGDTVYVTCGDLGAGATTVLWALNLNDPTAWELLPDCPGPARVLPIAAAQHDGSGTELFLFSGRRPYDGGTEYLTDTWSYDPGARAWERRADIVVGGQPRCVMAGTGVANGANHVLVFGGANGRLFQKLAHDFPAAIAAATEAGDAAQAAAVEAEKLGILNDHPGFSRDVLAYHAITDTWAKVGTIDGDSPVTTAAVRWGKSIVIPSGEKSPGIRTTQALMVTPERKAAFGTLNYTVLFIYLAAIILNGMYFSTKMKSTDDFFKAGGRIPWWAAGLSIFGTQLSAITFIAVPASSFATDWKRFVGYAGILAVAPLVIFLFLPFYRRLNVTTAYEYLEKRFNVVARTFASVMFILLQFGRIGIVLLLPSMALSVVTGMSIDMCIVLMGGLCILYTVMGGMEAVIWTDVTQVCILGGGAILALFMIPFNVAGGWNGMVDIADAANKFHLLDFRFSFTEAAFFVVLFGSFSQNLISYGTDQAVVQRYLTTKDEKAAARSIWLNALISIPAGMLFLGIGSALFAFYSSHPAALDFSLAKNDALFPLFIVTQLPAGIAGLLIAGVFAASMSSLDSSMNSVAAAVTTDFYRRFGGDVSEKACLRLARIATVTVGGLGTAFALVMAHSGIKSLWDTFAGMLGLFGGGLGGLFLLAIFTRRAHGKGAVVGLIASGVVQYLIKTRTGIHPWFFAFTGIASCMILGYLASIIIPEKKKSIDGLTIYTLNGGSSAE